MVGCRGQFASLQLYSCVWQPLSLSLTEQQQQQKALITSLSVSLSLSLGLCLGLSLSLSVCLSLSPSLSLSVRPVESHNSVGSVHATTLGYRVTTQSKPDTVKSVLERCNHPLADSPSRRHGWTLWLRCSRMAACCLLAS